MSETHDHYRDLMAELQNTVTQYLARNPNCNAGVAAQVLRDLANALAGHHGH